MIKKIVIAATTTIMLLNQCSWAKVLAPGITYTKLTIKQPCLGVVHILETEPSNVEYVLSKSGDTCKSIATVATMAQQSSAIAGINGGFHVTSGIPNGIIKVENTWYADQTKKRAALGWNKENTILLFDIIDTNRKLILGNKLHTIHALNKPRKPSSSVIYTPAFGKTTGTDSTGFEIIVIDNKVASVNDAGNTPIPSNGFVYSVGKNLKKNLSTINIGTHARFSVTIIPTNTNLEQWNQCDYILGGTPLLIQHGKRITDFSQEKTLQKFLTDKFARTAVGLTKKKRLIFVAVENLDMDDNDGMTMEELAKLMELLTCTDALCLAGGHSSTLVINNNMKNNPHGQWSFFGSVNWEKEVSNALLIKQKIAT